MCHIIKMKSGSVRSLPTLDDTIFIDPYSFKENRQENTDREIQLQYCTFWKRYQLLYTVILPSRKVLQLPRQGHCPHTSSWLRIHVHIVIVVQIVAFGKIKRAWKDLKLPTYNSKAFSDNVFIFARFSECFSVNNAMHSAWLIPSPL